MSLIQDLSQRIAAEAGQSSSLCSTHVDDDIPHHAQQQIHLKYLLAKSMTVFRQHLSLKATTQNINANHTRHIIHDVQSDSDQSYTFKGDFSEITSYAAVPITSRTGQLVGCYCVMEKQVRDDFSNDQTYTVLADIASAVAQYIEGKSNGHDNDRGRCDGHSFSSDVSSSSVSSDTSLDDTPLTTPNEAPEFSFNIQLPSKPSSPSLPSRRSNDTIKPSVAAVEATKTDFVSSISHELRSPLHGCLAAAELLQETKLDNTQSDLVGMVLACSSTLLYTLNHLLDYSRVNNLEAGAGEDHEVDLAQSNAGQSRFGQTSEDYLCRLVQDVVEGVHFGHTMQHAAYNKMQTVPANNLAQSQLDPAMFLDDSADLTSVASSEASHDLGVFLFMESRAAWFSMVSAGAWKRLVMNLFGNSLKFCSSGYIQVRLEMVADPSKPEKRLAHLMVKDTGIGMSEDFVKCGLYEPFVQENSLANGTGVGLHIVKRIVDDMHGTISVNSSLGSGTQFDVFAPIVEPKIPSDKSLNGGQILDPPGFLTGRTICLYSFHDLMDTNECTQRTFLVHSYVRSIAEDWFHMKVINADISADVDADFYVAEALDFAMHARANKGLSRADLKERTVLVGTPMQLAQTGRVISKNVVEMTYPLGPRALVRALYAAMEKIVSFATDDDSITLDPISHFPDKQHPCAQPFISKQSPVTPLETLLDQREEEMAPAKPPNNTRTDASPHLLLVDDNAINLRLPATFVKRLGFSYETAVDGADALAKYKHHSNSHSFTTILMDISMPNMNGFESSRAIRKFEAERGIASSRIIALTALGSEKSRREAERSGIGEFQMKPVSLKTLKGLFPDAAAA